MNPSRAPVFLLSKQAYVLKVILIDKTGFFYIWWTEQLEYQLLYKWKIISQKKTAKRKRISHMFLNFFPPLVWAPRKHVQLLHSKQVYKSLKNFLFFKIKEINKLTNLEIEDGERGELSVCVPSSEMPEMQLGSWGSLNELKLGMEADNFCSKTIPGEEEEEGVEVEVEVEVEELEESFPERETEKSPLKLAAHLGFHVQPTKTPTKTAIQRGAANIISSVMISPIEEEGLWKISIKSDTETIII